MNKKILYPNGLKLVCDTVSGVKSASFGVWVAVGSNKETEETNGLSHFTEHMLFKGTDKYSAIEIAQKFESFGASINAFTSKGATCYYFKCIDEYLEKCVELLSHIFFDSIFDPIELDKERKVILEEIGMSEDSGDDICSDLLAKSLYGNSAYGLTILGETSNIKRFSSSDVKKFISEFYAANNMAVSFAGSVLIKQADELTKKYILPKLKYKKQTLFEPEKIEVKKTHTEREKDFEQANIALAFESLPFDHPKSPAQTLLSAIVGGSMSSRLFQAIRENLGLCYSIYSTPSSHLNNGSFNIAINTNPKNAQKAVDATKKEIEKILAKDISLDELNRAKIQIKSALIFSREVVQSIMTANGKLLLLADKVFDIEDKVKKIEQVTLDELNCLSTQIFSFDKMCSAYVGKNTSLKIS